MAATRKARVPMAEQIRLINECRRSGMTDADWCRENGIAVSTFYNWVSGLSGNDLTLVSSNCVCLTSIQSIP